MQISQSEPRRMERNGTVYHEIDITTVQTLEIPMSLDTSHLITEDDEAVDNIFSEQQQRLLVDTLRHAPELWNPENRPFVTMANVGIFASLRNPAIVPDVLLSMDTAVPQDDEKRVDYASLRSYFVWEFGKMPDVVIEVVSNRKGKEMSRKMKEYEQMHIPYYVVFDPFGEIAKSMNGDVLHVYELHGGSYRLLTDFWLETVGIGLRLWEGVYEDCRATWLRWCDERGNVFPTGVESVAREKSRAASAESRATSAESRATSAELRAERLAERLRTLGINPDE